MTFEIKDYFETPVILEPRVELYTVYDFMGKELPGLAIVLDMINQPKPHACFFPRYRTNSTGRSTVILRRS